MSKEAWICFELGTVRGDSVIEYLHKFYLEGRRNEARLKLQLVKQQLSRTLAKLQREGNVWSFSCFGNVLACAGVQI